MVMKMKKELKLLEVFSLASGAMISSGIFILPAILYNEVGPSMIDAYILASIFVIPAMLSKAELATAMPKAGGDYFFIHRSLGALFGTFAGFSAWFSLCLKSAFALVGIGIFLGPLFPQLPLEIAIKIIGVSVTLIFTMLNIVSVKESGKIQVFMVAGLIIVLILYFIFGISHINIHNFVPFAKGGTRELFLATGMVFISFAGLTNIASIAEEIENPNKNIPIGMFSALLVVSILYVLTVFVTIGVLDKTILASTLTPLSITAGILFGKPGYILLSFAAMLAFVTTGNAGLMAASRNPLAMASDGLIPKKMTRLSKTYKTPIISILMTSIFIIISITALNLEELVKVASTMKLILFAFVNLSVILMRESKICTYKPSYKAPFYPYIQIIGIIIYIALIIEMGRGPLILTALFFTFSIIWYFTYSKKGNKNESAFIHILERLTSKEIRSTQLSDELREILIERDEIIEDRFDKIIKNADIIDIKENMEIEDFFNLASNIMSNKLNLDKEIIFNLLWEREKESSTVMKEGLAIPHLVTPNEDSFEILVARCKDGINFSVEGKIVNTVFVLAGSKNERNFHLKALMSIGQIVSDKDFISKWMQAVDENELRNILLLSNRKRG
jgi:amino acid transporter